MIHPTAVIHPQARVGDRTRIGPYCVIGEHVQIGDECHLHSHVVVDGHTVIGHRNQLFPFTSVGLQTQDLKWNGGITHTLIGDDNTFREFVTVNSATADGESTVIGSRNHILATSHIAHNAVLGNDIIISCAVMAGHVTLEDRAVIGGLAAIHQFCRIGRMAIVGGCSKVVQDIPPFMLADGNPATVRTVNRVGLERNQVSVEAQAALKQAHRLLFREGLTMTNAISRIEAELPPLEEIQHLVAFVRSSQRGIAR
jgi:UDP-N-acetylglucosamine acyltransferase